MKILDAAQFKEASKITSEKQQISLQGLMERTSTIVFKVMDQKLQGAPGPIKVLCGIGDNGGDGLVIARHLIQHGYHVKVFVLNCSTKRSKNFLANYDKIKDVTKEWPTLITKEDDFPEIKKTDFVVDAIFGSGLNRPLDGWVNDFLKHVNSSGAFILSVDIPSGMFLNRIPAEAEMILKAYYTLTYQTPKLVFFLPSIAEYVGVLEVIDIGLEREYLQKVKTSAILINKNEAAALFKARKKISHKGSYGHALMVGGSYGKVGSICLSTLAAMRTGAGLTTVFAPSCAYNVVQNFIPEAMMITDENEKVITNINFDFEPNVICFGVGVGTEEATFQTFKNLLQQTKKPLVIDADGLNLLSKHAELLQFIPQGSVLTPHPKELERLIGSWKDDLEKLEKTKSFAEKYKVIIVVKGAYTFTVTPESLYINNSGNPGMATAGSGDVLAGIISGLMAQAYEPLNAAVLGVYLHGRAGDFAANQKSQQAMIARDIVAHIGNAFFSLFEKPATEQKK